jgi:hypothetical protein
MNVGARFALGCSILLAGCLRHPALDSCGRPVVPAPTPIRSIAAGREYDASLGSVGRGRLVVAVYTEGRADSAPAQSQTRAQVSLTARFAEGFLAHVWRGATEATQPAVLDSVFAGQYVLAVAPSSVSPFRFLLRIRAGYTDSVRVTFRPPTPVAACPTP